MKVIGNTTHIGVTIKDLCKIYKDDATIPVSKKALKAYMMAAGISEEDIPSLSSAKVGDGSEMPPITDLKPEVLPPIELNISDGDW